MKKFFLLVMLCCTISPFLQSQTVADSVAIVTAKWDVTKYDEGIVCKTAVFPLYQSSQSVNIIEIDPKKGYKTDIAISRTMLPTSSIAEKRHAIAAINGSYFDMKKGNSVCYLRMGKEVIDTTSVEEFAIRVTGAIMSHKGGLKIVPWSPEVEKNYRKKKCNVLASGPLMLCGGRYYDWKNCEKGFIDTRHPRSAVATTFDGKIMLVAIDGRFKGKAQGMSIPELAYLVKVLGGKDALNLDGGGSTTLWIKGNIVNHPTDNGKFDHKGERGMPNILYIYR